MGHQAKIETLPLDEGKCRSCGASIVWITTERGKKMPCDPNPYTVQVPIEEDMPRGKNSFVPPGQLKWVTWITVRGLNSHFATCPNAKEHRKQK